MLLKLVLLQVTQRAFEMSAALSLLTMLNSDTGQNSENLNMLNSRFDLSSLQVRFMNTCIFFRVICMLILNLLS